VSFLWIIASLGPPVLLLAYGVFKARESWLSPALWVGLAAGVAAGILALLVEAALTAWLGLDAAATGGTVGARAVLRGFFVAGLPEEALKLGALLAVMLMLDASRLRSLVMVAIAVAMGFAAFENVLYLAKAGSAWQTVALLRGGSAVPIH
jgi:RsiW-degrading membrane proteinase PrsW (M82 family)